MFALERTIDEEDDNVHKDYECKDGKRGHAGAGIKLERVVVENRCVRQLLTALEKRIDRLVMCDV